MIWKLLISISLSVLLYYIIRRSNPEIFLEGETKFKPVTLTNIQKLNHDCRIFTFNTQNPSYDLGLPIGKHLVFRSTIKGEEVIRKYTPIQHTKDTFDVLIKIYYPILEFPEGGKMTQYIDSLSIGDTIEVAGPRGNIEYIKENTFRLLENDQFNEIRVEHLGMIAGGSGITPVFQMMKYIIDQNHDVKLYLIFANKLIEDIVLREELEKYQQMGKLRVVHLLSRPSEEWDGRIGHITQELVDEVMPQPSNSTLICYCGPREMTGLVKTFLSGYEHQYKF